MTKVTTYGWLSSYVPGTAARKEKLAAEQQARQEAKQKAEDEAVQQLQAKMDSPEGRAAAEMLWKTRDVESLEEATGRAHLRRWLVAREWDVELTYKCIVQHATWRMLHVPKGFVDESEVEVPLSEDKVFVQGLDNRGRSLVIIKVCNHVMRKDLKDMRSFTLYVIDALVRMCDTERNPGRRLVSIFDLSNGAQSLDMACLRMILGMLSLHYVERMEGLYFYNPPLLFWGLWHATRPLLPVATRDRIKVIDPADLRDLQQSVPADVLPKEYGGTAELLALPVAMRKFKIYPYLDGENKCPEALAAAAAVAAAGGGCGGPGECAADVDAEVEDELGQLAKMQHSNGSHLAGVSSGELEAEGMQQAVEVRV